jgi:N-acetylglutamate synthase-like GNAT family acetyltransferase
VNNAFKIRNAQPEEFEQIGQLMVSVYSNLQNFPKPDEQPAYYTMLANVGDLINKPGTEILVAESAKKIVGAVVYFADMQFYGSGGIATQEKNTAGFRLLAVDMQARGTGVGKALTLECVRKAKAQARRQVIIHTTMAMQNAWQMYERIGFKRSEDLDFKQGDLSVFGFRYLFDHS